MERRALRAVAAQFFVNGFIFASFVPRLPEIRDRIGVDLATMGLLLTASGVAGFVASAVVGRLVARFGTRRLLAITGVALAAVLPVMGYATTPAIFVLGAAGLAALDVTVDVSMNIQGSRLSEKRHAPVMNRLHALWSVGTVFGGLLASRVSAAGIALSTHLVVVGVVFVGVVVVISRRMLRTDDSLVSPDPDRLDAGAVDTDPVDTSARGPSSRRASVIFAVLGFAAIMPEVSSSDWVSFRGTDDLGVGPGLAGLGFVAFTTGMVIGRVGGDSLQARLGRGRLSAVSPVLSTAGIGVMTLIPAFPAVLMGAVIAGLGVSVFFPMLYDDAARAGGGNAGALGAMTAGSRLGFMALPLMVGGIADSSLTGVGGAMAIVSLPALLVILLVNRWRATLGSH